ncbi:hypothetical protein ACE6H2_014847 [Prunus campanulata]
MKLSFSLPSKPSSNHIPKPSTTFNDSNADPNNDGSIQYVHEFDASQPLRGDPKTSVIPPIPNEWLMKPESENRSEVRSLSARISNGLNLRPKLESENGEGDERLRSAGVDLEALALQKLKEDLERLPEHRGMEEYNDVSVDGFGSALLAGYGWCPGEGIGKHTEKDVKVVEFNRRPNDRHGLGFRMGRGDDQQ